MPITPRETILCRYRYDPLDRLVDCAPLSQANLQRFYCKSRLANEIQGANRSTVFQYDDHLLAQHQQDASARESRLLATDAQRSVLHCLSPQQQQPSAYSPYGQRTARNGLLSLLGFNGERPDPLTGHYLLGNGYRAFNPVLMRFNSPDSLSPFAEGGFNSYAYCLGDPVNQIDPNGHSPLKRLAKMIEGLSKPPRPPRPIASSSGTVAQTAASAAPRGRGSRLLSPEERRIRRNNNSARHRTKLKNLAETIERNEAIRPPSTLYYGAEKITDPATLESAYLQAKEAGVYNFSGAYPDLSIKHMIKINDVYVLDVTHFNLAIDYLKSNSNSLNIGNYGNAHRAIIKRAEYIREFAKVDLFTLHPPSPRSTSPAGR
ncbi:RHS repeat-associated core domain-containing protein [Pseudomonas batumici]|nr:RHS repeat-associated core domain-containing protein [Pseudomonas batumici]